MLKLLIAYYKNLSLEEWVWFFIWFSLPISIRFNSLAIIFGGIILLVSFIKAPHTLYYKQLLYYLLPFLFFGIHAMGVTKGFYNINAWKELEQMLPLLVIPILFLLGSIKKRSFTQLSLTAMVFSLIISGVIMLSNSIWNFNNDCDLSHFIYHQFVSPINSGAIYHSFFLLVTLIQINELVWLARYRSLKYAIVAFFLLMLFLSASKLIIGIGIPVMILKYRKEILGTLKRRKILIPILVIFSAIILIPFGLRLSEISNPNLDIVSAKQYRWDSPLNGLNLRLIQARFGLEVLDENNAWVTGVGINNSQRLLDSQYIKYGIYTGYEGTDDTGYLNYNFHNQFVETLVRSGIIGLLLLVTMFIVMIATPQTYLFVSKWIIIVIATFFLTESVLERQLGIVYFCLIYSSYFLQKSKVELK